MAAALMLVRDRYRYIPWGTRAPQCPRVTRVVGARHDAPHVYTRMEAEASLRQSGQRKATRGAVTGAVPGAVPGGGGGVGGVLGGGGMAVAEHSAHKHRWPQGMRACVRSRSWHTTHVVCALAPSWAPSAPETAPMDPPIPK